MPFIKDTSNFVLEQYNFESSFTEALDRLMFRLNPVAVEASNFSILSLFYEDRTFDRWEFRASKLKDCRFRNCTFNAVNFRGAFIKACNFTNCLFNNCTFAATESIRGCFVGCDFHKCNMNESYFYLINLLGCKFEDTTFTNARFCRMSVEGNVFINTPIPASSQICPPLGGFVAYKSLQNSLAVLYIPPEAERVNGLGQNKARASQAYVIALINAEGNLDTDHAHFRDLLYRAEANVFPDCFDNNPGDTCSSGIHFYLDINLALAKLDDTAALRQKAKEAIAAFYKGEAK